MHQLGKHVPAGAGRKRGVADDDVGGLPVPEHLDPGLRHSPVPLPVLFWIHGGAFLHGCGSEKEFDGEGFAKKGVILVTINYRVNAFGFFAHPALEEETEEGVSGNYGIFDRFSPWTGSSRTSPPLGATRTPSPWRGSPPAA